jgi:hypothetical protein
MGGVIALCGDIKGVNGLSIRAKKPPWLWDSLPENPRIHEGNPLRVSPGHGAAARFF